MTKSPDGRARWTGVPEVAAPSHPTEDAGDDSSSIPGQSKLDQQSRTSAVLISTILHTCVLILLALIGLSGPPASGPDLVARQGDQARELILEQVDPQEIAIDNDDQDASTQPIAIDVSDVFEPAAAGDQASVELPANVLPSDSFDAVSGGSRGSSALIRIPSGGGLSGRTPDQRQQLAQKYGATAESEDAVENALKYLAAHQRPNGSWSFDLSLAPCQGRCRHSRKSGKDTTPSTAATGLALLAFLGAGHTHASGDAYSETVRRGLYYLRGVAVETDSGIDWQEGSMYGHGIALMAVAEAVGMTSPENPSSNDFYHLVQDGATFGCAAQHSTGSWGYYPRSPGDMTVSGWQVLSLIAAKRNGVRLSTNTLADAKRFALSTTTGGDRSFGYKGPPARPTTTAIGLTMMLYFGESPRYTPLYKALTDLAERGPLLTNIYHDYYATLALHHSRHHLWDKWNQRMRDHLVQTQEQSGHEKGSWHFKDRWGDVGGRLYTTAMCALTLEVYYRYLPLYGDQSEFEL